MDSRGRLALKSLFSFALVAAILLLPGCEQLAPGGSFVFPRSFTIGGGRADYAGVGWSPAALLSGAAASQSPTSWTDVREYGARFDGNDDTTAIQNALKACDPTFGCVIKLPCGRTLISAPLIPKTQTWILGCGRMNTVLRANAAHPPGRLIDLGNGTPGSVNHIRIEALQLEVQGSTHSDAIRFNGARESTLEDFTIKPSSLRDQKGIVFADGTSSIDNRVLNGQILNAGGDAIYIGGGAHGTVIANVVCASGNSATARCVALDNAVNVHLDHVVFGDANIGLDAGFATGGAEFVCTQCYFEDITTAAIRVSGNGSNGTTGGTIIEPITVGLNRGSHGLELKDLGDGHRYNTVNDLTIIGGGLGTDLTAAAVYVGPNVIGGPVTIWGTELNAATPGGRTPTGPGLPGLYQGLTYLTTRATPSAIPVGRSPFTYTNKDNFTETVYISGGTVSSISIVRHSTKTELRAATGMPVILAPGDGVQVTYSSAPAMVKVPF